MDLRKAPKARYSLTVDRIDGTKSKEGGVIQGVLGRRCSRKRIAKESMWQKQEQISGGVCC